MVSGWALKGEKEIGKRKNGEKLPALDYFGLQKPRNNLGWITDKLESDESAFEEN